MDLDLDHEFVRFGTRAWAVGSGWERDGRWGRDEDQERDKREGGTGRTIDDGDGEEHLKEG